SAERSRIDAERAGLVAQRRERTGQRERLVAWLQDLRGQQDAAERRTVAVAEGRETQEAELRRLEEQRLATAAALDELRERHEALLGQVAARRDAASEGDVALMQAQQHLAALEERLRAGERQVAGLQSQRQGQAEESAVRERR